MYFALFRNRIQVDELNASIKSYQSQIAEKDAKLSEYKSQAEDQSASQREKELFDELATYKAKNNVSHWHSRFSMLALFE